MLLVASLVNCKHSVFHAVNVMHADVSLCKFNSSLIVTRKKLLACTTMVTGESVVALLSLCCSATLCTATEGTTSVDTIRNFCPMGNLISFFNANGQMLGGAIATDSNGVK